MNNITKTAKPMPKIDIELITLEYLREAFLLDCENGLLFWRVRPAHHFADRRAMNSVNGRAAGRLAGSIKTDKRRCVRINGRDCFAYRVIYALHHSLSLSEVPEIIDHKDGDPTNDRPENLRAASPQQNQFNRRPKATANGRFKGISKVSGGRWRAYIFVGGKGKSLGWHDSPEDAARAYDAAAAKIHGEYMRKQF